MLSVSDNYLRLLQTHSLKHIFTQATRLPLLSLRLIYHYSNHLRKYIKNIFDLKGLYKNINAIKPLSFIFPLFALKLGWSQTVGQKKMDWNTFPNFEEAKLSEEIDYLLVSLFFQVCEYPTIKSNITFSKIK